MIEYDLIKETYGERRAKRSGLPYLRHIDQGLILLRALEVDGDVLRAWCLHPIFQLDEFYVPMVREGRVLRQISSRLAVLAMEYRAVANAYLTKNESEDRLPKISPIDEVNLMLIVDKIQNWRDARLFPHVSEEERAKLNRYFEKWLKELKFQPYQRKNLEALLAEDDLWRTKKS
jgi:hypothetical protein